MLEIPRWLIRSPNKSVLHDLFVMLHLAIKHWWRQWNNVTKKLDFARKRMQTANLWFAMSRFRFQLMVLQLQFLPQRSSVFLCGGLYCSMQLQLWISLPLPFQIQWNEGKLQEEKKKKTFPVELKSQLQLEVSSYLQFCRWWRWSLVCMPGTVCVSVCAHKWVLLLLTDMRLDLCVHVLVLLFVSFLNYTLAEYNIS